MSFTASSNLTLSIGSIKPKSKSLAKEDTARPLKTSTLEDLWRS